MKKLLCIVAIAVTFVQQASAQQASFLDKVSLEAGYGYNMALRPDNIETSDVSGFNTVQLGLNYQINDIWGVRGTYSNTTFKHKDVENASINYNKLTAEATFNVMEAVNASAYPTSSTFQLVAHTGAGLNFGKSKATDQTDMIANFQIGIKPQYNITNRIGVFLDGTYIMNFKQNYGFNGMAIPGESETTGSYVTGLIGVAVKLGR